MPVGDEDMVIVFRRVGDRIQVVRRNIHYKAPAGSLGKSVKQNYTDSVLMALPILAINPMRGMAAIVDFSDVFLTDFAQLGLGRSTATAAVGPRSRASPRTWSWRSRRPSPAAAARCAARTTASPTIAGSPW